MGMKVLGQKPLPVSLHSAMNPTRTELGSSPGLRNDRSAINSLNNGTVTPQYEHVKYVCWIRSNDKPLVQRSTRIRQLVRKLLGGGRGETSWYRRDNLLWEGNKGRAPSRILAQLSYCICISPYMYITIITLQINVRHLPCYTVSYKLSCVTAVIKRIKQYKQFIT